MTDLQTETRQKYHAVNSQWPDVVPELTGDEAMAAAKRLYRLAMKKAWPGKWELTSGNRFTWARGRTFYVNPKRTGWGVVNGWHDLVHMMSHYCHRQLHPRAKPHSGAHHFLEKERVAYVVAQGWLNGTLRKPDAPKVDAAAIRHQRTLDGIARWEAKRKRADTALKKLRKRAAYYAKNPRTRH